MVDYENNCDNEKRDINVTKIALWGITGLLFVVISLIIVSEYLLTVKEDYYYEMVRRPKPKDLKEMRQREAEELTSYKILDEKNGVYRIPIRQAMELLDDENSKRAVK